MKELFSDAFFSLEERAWPELFKSETPAWSSLLNLRNFLDKQSLGKIEIDIPPGVYLVNPSQISIEKECVIEPGAYICGPVILKSGTIVRHGAYIRGYVIAEEGCVIGHATEVKYSIFLKGSKAAHLSYVGDSILGEGVNLGAGVKLANRRFDDSPITLVYADQKIKTGLKKMGAIIGDKTQMGCNAVTSPGTLIGPNSFCYPNVTVQGILPRRTIYKGKKL